MSEWYGKGCKYQCCRWEESKEANPDFMNAEPCLIFCNHKENPDEYEGNCIEQTCPEGV